MSKGGYKIIDLKNKNLTTGAFTTIKGIYNSIEHSYQKPLILHGINIDGVEMNDVAITPTVTGQDYTIRAYANTYTISADDKVTMA